jgi:hypothetical protein
MGALDANYNRVMPVGQYRGYYIDDVIKKDPRYVNWCAKNKVIDLTIHEKNYLATVLAEKMEEMEERMNAPQKPSGIKKVPSKLSRTGIELKPEMLKYEADNIPKPNIKGKAQPKKGCKK